ncbi:MAG: peptidoglycan bridge formation glycyltransferase FemA/FemB family protein [Ignavibacteriae bacterium]|nr:peptidoglycan bridge formation glycyltransferase FemA/FemB family protein [Ignavibacteriota bacterium]
MKKAIRLYEKEFYRAEEFLENNFSSPTHWTDWNILASRYFNTDFFYFAIEDDNEIIGICPVHSIKNKLNHRLVSGPKEFSIPYGGWIFSKLSRFEKSNLIMKENESFELFSLPLLNNFNVEYENYKLLKMYETAVIDLSRTEDDIWDSLPSQRRNKIRKAIKQNVKISDLSETGIDNFYDFYNLTNPAYGLKNLSKAFFEDLFSVQKNFKTDVLVASADSVLLGAVVIVSDKSYSIYWIGTRLESAPNNGYFDLLQWEAIKKAKQNGCSFYDLCYIEKDRLPNIYKFKTDYSRKVISVLNLIYKPLLFRAINKIQKLF